MRNKTSEKEKLRCKKKYAVRRAAIRDNFLRKTYGITLDQYNQMLKDQNGCCAICKKPETTVDARYGRVRDLAVDHCHETGKIRGLLCDRHNRGIGHFDDSPEMLTAAIFYITNNKNGS